jgi:hypothetical protein
MFHGGIFHILSSFWAASSIIVRVFSIFYFYIYLFIFFPDIFHRKKKKISAASFHGLLPEDKGITRIGPGLHYCAMGPLYPMVPLYG